MPTEEFKLAIGGGGQIPSYRFPNTAGAVTYCPRMLDTLYIVIYNIQWVKVGYTVALTHGVPGIAGVLVCS